MAGITVNEARRLFPGAARSVYMNVGVRGLLSTVVRDAVEQYLDEHVRENASLSLW